MQNRNRKRNQTNGKFSYRSKSYRVRLPSFYNVRKKRRSSAEVGE